MKISVIIPTYNGERTIGRAIKSIFNQTYKTNYEILICDDCSTDDTIKKIDNIFYPNIKVITNDIHTGGPNKGRNNGIKNATGDYIAFLDQDDEWLPTKIETQITKLISNGKELAYSSYITRKE